MENKFKIDIDVLLENELNMEGYFILWCLFHKEELLLVTYVNKCRKIPTEIFDDLQERQLLTITRQTKDDNISYKMLAITSKGKTLFEVVNIDELFNKFREFYPKKAGTQGRALHLDLKRCKSLYKKIIGNKIEKHDLLCKCATLYHLEKQRLGSEVYMQNLASWLYQGNYEEYMHDARNTKVELIKEEGHSEDI